MNFETYKANLKGNESGGLRYSIKCYLKFLVVKNWFENKGIEMFCLGCDEKNNTYEFYQVAHIHAETCNKSCDDSNCKKKERKNWENLSLLCETCNKKMNNLHAKKFFSFSRYSNFLMLASIEATNEQKAIAYDVVVNRNYENNLKQSKCEIVRNSEIDLWQV